MRPWTATLCLALTALPAAAAELPIFDAHVHYSHDAWDNLPPKEAVAILRKAGLKRALVSSSGDEGTQRLVEAAPDLILPSLRPYRSRADVSTWVRDATVVPFLEDRLARHRYVALGDTFTSGDGLAPWGTWIAPLVGFALWPWMFLLLDELRLRLRERERGA